MQCTRTKTRVGDDQFAWENGDNGEDNGGARLRVGAVEPNLYLASAPTQLARQRKRAGSGKFTGGRIPFYPLERRGESK